MLRVVKSYGYIYLSAPSNSEYHSYRQNNCVVMFRKINQSHPTQGIFPPYLFL